MATINTPTILVRVTRPGSIFATVTYTRPWAFCKGEASGAGLSAFRATRQVQAGEPVEAFQVWPVHAGRDGAQDLEVTLKELDIDLGDGFQGFAKLVDDRPGHGAAGPHVELDRVVDP